METLLNKNHVTYEAFERIGVKDHHGINLPLFSLRSKKGAGVGEYLDLIPLIDWVSSLGFDIIQLLPLNDSGLESSPYNAFSSTALNPLFLSLWDLPYLDRYLSLREQLEGFHKYTPLQRLPYDAVLNAKIEFLENYFNTAFHHLQDSPDYLTFQQEHPWLKLYALFKVLKQEHAHQDWTFWHSSLRNPSKYMLNALAKEKERKIQFWIMVQFFCFDQMRRVRKHGQAKNVFLKGDIPILISPQSQDVWLYRKDFNLDYSAGSPPDFFTKEGQNWGFPLFRWDVIEQDGYTWWQERLKTAEKLYDIYRIDHIIGFYRIWAIERGRKATEGTFRPKDKWAALEQGNRILRTLVPMSKMLPIGEDLGHDIAHIREALSDLGICGSRVMRWERNYDTDRSYIPLASYPRLSLTTVSTHDCDTLAQWWKKFPDEAKDYCAFQNLPYQANLTAPLRYALLKGSHKTASLFHINLLGEYLALFDNLVWTNNEDERINVPGIIHPKNWCYRFRPYLEEIISHNDLSQAMRSMIK